MRANLDNILMQKDASQIKTMADSGASARDIAAALGKAEKVVAAFIGPAKPKKKAKTIEE